MMNLPSYTELQERWAQVEQERRRRQQVVRRRRAIGLLVAVCLLAFLLAFLWLADFAYETDQYELGYAAYKAGDCTTARSYMRRLWNDYRLLTIPFVRKSVYADEALTILQQCMPLSDAEIAYVRQSPGEALAAYLAIPEGVLPQRLLDQKNTQMQMVVRATRPEMLATKQACRQASSVLVLAGYEREGGDGAAFLSNCGQLLTEAKLSGLAFDIYLTGLRDFSTTSQAPAFGQGIRESPIRCQQMERLVEIDQPDVAVDVMLDCGEQYEAEGELSEAITTFQRILTLFPNHKRQDDVERALARSLIAQAEDQDVAEIAPPPVTRRIRGEKAVLSIQNSAPETIRLALEGPDSQVDRIPSCPSCRTYTRDPQECPDQGPSVTYTLDPGTYRVLVESSSDDSVIPYTQEDFEYLELADESSSDESVIPYTGSWELEAGYEYSHCFFIVTRQAP